MAYPRIKELIERHVASGLIYLPSSSADLESEAIRPYLDRFIRGSNGYAAIDRIKLLKLLWDAIGTESSCTSATTRGTTKICAWKP